MGTPKTAEVLAGVRRLAALIHERAELAQVHQALGEELIDALAMDAVHVLTVDAEHRPVASAVITPGGNVVEELLPGDVRPSATEWVAANATPVIVPDASAPGTLPPEMVEEYGIACAALLPLVAGGAVRAVVILSSRTPRDWPPAELEIALTLTDLVAAAVALHDAHEAARTDPLTNCLNHGAMLARLSEEISRARRQRTPLACLLLDLDNFKQVNDRQGHPAGDALLRHVSEVLRSEFRSFDQVARYGGDEFLVILPNASGDRGEAAARRALRLLREIRVPYGDAIVQGITVSVGCAQWEEGDTVGDLLDRADLALRAGKAAGKDTIGVAPPGRPPGRSGDPRDER
jgi:diguanylate cyclase (GGDEF)-like protein